MAHRSLAIFRRRLFTILSGLSLLLCLATIALWVRSYRWFDIASYGYGAEVKRSWDISSRSGALHLVTSFEGRGFRYLLVPGFSWEAQSSATSSPDFWEVARITTWFHKGSSHRVLGFGFMRMTWETGASIRGISIPHWFLALIFAIFPALYLRAAIRSRRRNRVGLCPVCGYDLRATPERCPECGSAASQIPITKPE